MLDNKLSYMEHWERDPYIQWYLTDLQDIANNLSTISINTALFEAINYKTLLRWYMVPTRIAKMNTQASSQCFL